MPWKEETRMSLRSDFVHHALQANTNFTELCRSFDISRKTGYKWLERFADGGESNLVDRSRRPHTSPIQTAPEIETAIVQVRQTHPTWGGRKIQARLQQAGHTHLPSPSTITEILRRQGLIDPEQAQKHVPFQRFEMEAPNRLWQMDFKGHFALTTGRCHPLTVLDDCSRYLLGLKACPNETARTVQADLTDIFREYGLPERMLMDHGSPWGAAGAQPYTALTLWLMRLGIGVSHGRPYHPQTQGKDERLHRTLQEELLSRTTFGNLWECQRRFDAWRQEYNCERPHEALGLVPPVVRYQPSPQSFPEQLPPIEYDQGEIVRKVDQSGKIYLHGRRFFVGVAFQGQPVAIRPTEIDGDLDVFFGAQRVAQISFRDDNC